MSNARRMAAAALFGLAMSLGGSVTAHGQQPAAKAADKRPLTIPVITVLSGPSAHLGQEAVAGYQAYFSWLNKRGGVDGHPVTLDIKDDRNDPTQSLTLYQGVPDSAPLVLGPTFAAATRAMLPEAQKRGIPVVCSGCAPTTAQDWNSGPLYAATLPDLIKAGTPTAQFMRSTLLPRYKLDRARVGFVFFDTGPVRNTQKSVAQALGKDGEFVNVGLYSPSKPDDAFPLLTAALAAKPNLMWIGLLNEPALIQAVRQLRQQGFQGPVLGWFSVMQQSAMQTLSDPDYYVPRPVVTLSEKGQPGAEDGVKFLETLHRDGVSEAVLNNAGQVETIAIGVLVTEALRKCKVTECTGAAFQDGLKSLKAFTANGLLRVDLSLSHDGVTGLRWARWSGGRLESTDWLKVTQP